MTKLNEAMQDAMYRMGVGNLVCKPTVGVVPKKRDPRLKECGSGTIVLTPKRRPVILTCAHWLREWQGQDLEMTWYKMTHAAFIPGDSALAYHPDDDLGEVDVAVLIPPKSLTTALGPLGRLANEIGDDSELIEHDIVSVTGFPSEYQRVDMEARRQGFSSFTVFGLEKREPGADDPRGPHVFDWCEGTWSVEDLDNRHARYMPDGPARDPSGMSGGASWRFRPFKEDDRTIWLPSDGSRIIGIQRSWSQKANRVRIEPVERWRTWVLAMLNEIDEGGY